MEAARRHRPGLPRGAVTSHSQEVPERHQRAGYCFRKFGSHDLSTLETRARFPLRQPADEDTLSACDGGHCQIPGFSAAANVCLRSGLPLPCISAGRATICSTAGGIPEPVGFSNLADKFTPETITREYLEMYSADSQGDRSVPMRTIATNRYAFATETAHF